ncbi:hypothetical protein PGT21_002782 [Puccinia graminis f. sp. tritici]|uniref:Uncharacterized protein n=1 Tax=Puccinia graminis f. sp. tritici TaxID=56615 RepID=A0A5B0ND57_PUCGR|nr:hypothetical protein PGTUg99_018895 [Puccinia graminis f. sp. tritici]KAA1088974.1 hypothetical protein PGT21_002782 [Puccinia graminis f. sp. tritici]
MSPAKDAGLAGFCHLKQAWHDRSDLFVLGRANLRSGVPDSYVPDSPRLGAPSAPSESPITTRRAIGMHVVPRARQTNCSDASPSPRKTQKTHHLAKTSIS